MQEDFAHIGAHLQDSGRNGYNRSVDAERGGYNVPVDTANDGYLDVEDVLVELMPLQRFLQEVGPWTPVSLLRG
jgi:hypothetical protein